MKDKRDKLILVLVFVIILLVGILAFVFLINPALNGLVVRGQNEGYNYAVQKIFSMASQCQEVQLNLENQTIKLISVDCLEG